MTFDSFEPAWSAFCRSAGVFGAPIFGADLMAGCPAEDAESIRVLLEEALAEVDDGGEVGPTAPTVSVVGTESEWIHRDGDGAVERVPDDVTIEFGTGRTFARLVIRHHAGYPTEYTVSVGVRADAFEGSTGEALAASLESAAASIRARESALAV